MDIDTFIIHAQHLRQKAIEASRQCGTPADEAQDIAQETIVRLWQLLGSVPNRQKAEALTARIARNMSIDYLRRNGRAIGLDTADMDRQAAEMPQPDELLEAHDDMAWLRSRLAELPSTEYAILHMRQVEGCSNEEIARRLGLQVASVSTLLARARRHLLAEIRQRRREK